MEQVKRPVMEICSPNFAVAQLVHHRLIVDTDQLFLSPQNRPKELMRDF